MLQVQGAGECRSRLHYAASNSSLPGAGFTAPVTGFVQSHDLYSCSFYLPIYPCMSSCLLLFFIFKLVHKCKLSVSGFILSPPPPPPPPALSHGLQEVPSHLFLPYVFGGNLHTGLEHGDGWDIALQVLKILSLGQVGCSCIKKKKKSMLFVIALPNLFTHTKSVISYIPTKTR